MSPVFLTRQAKGRLQHALRVSGSTTPFSRKGSVGTVGDNTKDDVESYIANQIVKEPVVDERFREKLGPFTVVNPDHMHLALCGNIAHSPQKSALKFVNNTAYALGQCAVWEPCFYAGTFGAYKYERHSPQARVNYVSHRL